MRRFTTPTINLTIRGADLTNCNVWLTLSQGGTMLTIRLDELEDWEPGEVTSTCPVTLTQEQSSMFSSTSSTLAQVNALSSDGFRWASEIDNVKLGRNLMEEVVRYEQSGT